MAKWISGSEIIQRWAIKDFELVEYVRDWGLEPHSERGQPYDSGSGHIPAGPGERIDNDDLRKMANPILELLGGEELLKLKAVCAISELPEHEETQLNTLVEEMGEAASKEKKAELEARYIEFVSERVSRLSEDQLNQGLHEYLDTVLSSSPAPGAAKSYFPWMTEFSWRFLSLEARTSRITRPDDWLHVLSTSLYRIEDVLRIEEETGRIPKEVEPVGTSNETTQSSDSVESTNAKKLSFYKAGNAWRVGPVGREQFLNDLKGMSIIHFLLQYPNKPITCTTLYHLDGGAPGLDAESQEGGTHLSKWRGVHIQTTPEQVDALQWSHNVSKGISLEPVRDRRERQEIESKLEELEEAYECCTDAQKRLELEEIIRIVKQQLDGDFAKDPDAEKIRQSVRKLVVAALKNIRNSSPEIAQFINEQTVKTGGSCSFNESLLPDEVEWKLDPPQ